MEDCELAILNLQYSILNFFVGTQRSLVAHMLGVHVVGGSNPLVPTKFYFRFQMLDFRFARQIFSQLNASDPRFKSEILNLKFEIFDSGRSAAWQRTWFGTRGLEVQILSPRLNFILDFRCQISDLRERSFVKKSESEPRSKAGMYLVLSDSHE